MSACIGAFDAKTHLSEYLERAFRGESFTITRRGEPIAELGPHSDGADDHRAILGECEALRRRIGVGEAGFDVVEAVRRDRDR